MRTFLFLIITGLWTNLGTTAPLTQPSMTLGVMSSGGFTAAYQALSQMFTRSTEIGLNTVYGASMGGAPSSIPSRLARGELADVVILATEGLDRLVADGHVLADSLVDLASSRIGMAVRSGGALPDISTVDQFVQTLLEADSIAYSASASGTYLATDLFHRLQIADRLADKSTRILGERVGVVVARGDAALGFQQISELLPIPGVTYVGPIPDEVQKVTIFSAGITTQAKNLTAAKALINFLASAQAAPIITQTGMVPLTTPSTR